MRDALLAYEDVEISYDGIPVVQGVSFTVEAGQILGIVGESGSGKSTLVKAAMGLLGTTGAVTGGDICYEGRSILGLSQRELRALCGPELAMVFQDCVAALTPIRTVGDQVYESLIAHGPVTRRESDSRAAALFEQLGLSDPKGVLAAYPFQLSGGMGQRVGIAMALLGNPKVLLADEPTSALDVVAQAQVVELLNRARHGTGVAVVLVTHNMGVVRAAANDVLVMKDGKAVEQGPALQVLQAPAESYTHELLRAASAIGGRR